PPSRVYPTVERHRAAITLRGTPHVVPHGPRMQCPDARPAGNPCCRRSLARLRAGPGAQRDWRSQGGDPLPQAERRGAAEEALADAVSRDPARGHRAGVPQRVLGQPRSRYLRRRRVRRAAVQLTRQVRIGYRVAELDRKSTRLNSSHGSISYAVFCLKKKKKKYTANEITRGRGGSAGI